MNTKEKLDLYKMAMQIHSISTDNRTHYIAFYTALKIQELGDKFSIKDAAQIQADADMFMEAFHPKEPIECLKKKDVDYPKNRFELESQPLIDSETLKANVLSDLGAEEQLDKDTKSITWLACEKFLNELPDGYRERALSQMDAKFIEDRDICESISDAVCRFNEWSVTNEGGNFWHKVFSYYDDSEQSLTPLPND